MKAAARHLLWIWAGREVLRRPGESSLLLLCLLLLTLLMTTALMLTQAFSETADALITQAPAVVVRRVTAGGWQPLPAGPALAAAAAVRGVLNPRVRIWGNVSGPQGTLMVVAHDARSPVTDQHGVALHLVPGQAAVGAGVSGVDARGGLALEGHESLHLEVVHRFPSETAASTYDLVLVTPADARRLLGLPEGFASDLVLDVFHEPEAEALLPELQGAFPWPVHLTTRRMVRGDYRSQLAKRGGIFVVSGLPALCGLLLILVATVKAVRNERATTGLIKALGWTSDDLLRLYLYKSLLIALPAIVGGIAGAYLLVFLPHNQWVADLFFGWPGPAPPLALSIQGVVWVAAQVAVLILAPFLTVTLWAALGSATADPQQLMQGGRFL
jgi:hypothetical protein